MLIARGVSIPAASVVPREFQTADGCARARLTRNDLPERGLGATSEWPTIAQSYEHLGLGALLSLRERPLFVTWMAIMEAVTTRPSDARNLEIEFGTG